jgi:hypothetical protein
LIIGVWIAILVILGFTASQFIKPTSSAISIPGTEAQKALEIVCEEMENACKMKVLLRADGKIGNTWFDAH